MSLISWALGWDKPVMCGSMPLTDRTKYLLQNYNEPDINLSEILHPYKQITYSACIDQI